MCVGEGGGAWGMHGEVRTCGMVVRTALHICRNIKRLAALEAYLISMYVYVHTHHGTTRVSADAQT